MTRPAKVEAELGRIPCIVTGNLASFLKPKEYIYSFSIDELLLSFSANVSYRKTAGIINRAIHRLDGKALKPSTLEDYIGRQGNRIGNALHEQAASVLADTPGMSEDGLVMDTDLIPESITAPVTQENGRIDKTSFFADVIGPYNKGREECDRIKDTRLINNTEISPGNSVYVSIDDVGVKHQKDTRKDGGSKDGKAVENTVIHIQSAEGEYVITDVGMDKAFRLLMAFLFSNRLLENRSLYFFSDGASNIRKSIETYFKGLCPYALMLDWYHLEKRMTELLSMALKGPKDIRHEIRKTLDQKLWAGNFDDAMVYIKSIECKYVKNKLRLDEAIDYLERKKQYACCYALRKELGYRNSSNPAEKANDIVVAFRQKHNGMSWSYDGSGSLASVTALAKNGESSIWIREGRIPFKPVSQSNEELATA